MADQDLDEQALGDEALRRGLLTKENLAEARETQRMATEAGLPITLAEVLIQKKYLNPVQVEGLQQRLRDQAQSPVATPNPEPQPESPDDAWSRLLQGTSPQPPAPAPKAERGSPPAGPFPEVPAAGSPAPKPKERRPSRRITRGRTPAGAVPTVSPKRGSGRAPAVSHGRRRRRTSVSTKSLPTTPPPRTSSRRKTRGTSKEKPVPAAAAPSVEQKPDVKTSTTEDVKHSTTPEGTGDAVTETPRKKRRALLAFFLLLLIVGGGVGAWWLFGRSGAPKRPNPTSSDGRAFGPRFTALSYWLVVGPFAVKDRKNIGIVHPPEHAGHQLKSAFKCAGKPIKWKLARMQESQVSFDRELGKHLDCNGYGLTYVESPRKMKVQLGIGSDDTVKVWLNGKVVHVNKTFRGLSVDQDKITVTLKAGINEIFIKVGQGSGEWGFAVTLKDPNGKPLTGLKGRLPKHIKLPKPAKPKRSTSSTKSKKTPDKKK